MHWALLFFVGIFAGFINVLAGGGSLLTLPTMIFMGIEGSLANGSNRVALVAQNMVAVRNFSRRGYPQPVLSRWLILLALPGALAGAWLGCRLTGPVFNRILGGVMLGVLVLMSKADEKKREGDPSECEEHSSSARRWLAGLGAVFIGFYAGFIQAGVGFVIIAVVHKLLGLSLVRTNVVKVGLILALNAVALIVFAMNGQVNWWVGLALAGGNSLGGFIGSQVAVGAKGELWAKWMLRIALLAMSIKLLWTW